MTQRKTLEGRAASWHPHPKDAPARPSNASLVPVVRPAADEMAHPFFDHPPVETAGQSDRAGDPRPRQAAEPSPAVDAGADLDDLEDDEAPASVARSRALASAPVRARRKYLMRYVAGAVGVAGLIGIAALVRITASPDARASEGRDHASAAAVAIEGAALPAAAPAEPEAKAAAPEIAQTAAPALVSDSVPPSGDVAAAAPAPAPAAASAAPAAAVDDTTAPALDPVAAREAKRDAQHAIDRNHFADAIEAGERSVALDPTDAEAWLILGAAYQEKGSYADARRCYSSCSHRATRGPRGECNALLR
jgi:hypothetical protein